MSNRNLMLYSLAVVLAIIASYVDLHNDEVQAPALVVLLGAGLLGLLEPKNAWRWGLIMGLSISCGGICSLLTGMNVPYEATPPYSTLIALIPAFIGAYIGVLFHKMFFSNHLVKSQ